ncbi:MAG: hypothetical protein KY448_05095 [Cyanobacteria bacterium 0813]|nr:hypothetical protein [Cyanobacteria bacterium 0813]
MFNSTSALVALEPLETHPSPQLLSKAAADRQYSKPLTHVETTTVTRPLTPFLG